MEDREVGKDNGLLAVIVAPIIVILVVLTIALALAAMFAHEAVEFLAVLGLAQIGHIFVERVDLGIEPGALFFEALELLGTVFVEGGADVARTFLAEDLVDRLILFTGEGSVDGDAVNAPVTRTTVPEAFRPLASMTYGTDQMDEYERA